MNTVYRTEKRYIMPTYGRARITLEYGSGIHVYDTQGRRYLDFIGGIATCSVGHANQYVTRAVHEQAGHLINATNLYYTEPQARLASRLSRHAGFATKAFFSNSGAEAVEAALKLARKHTGKPQIIAARQAFHGRTYGALAATWKPRYKKPFTPSLPGFKHIPYNAPAALARAISQRTAAFIVEPIQGEEGVITPDPGYLSAVSRICKQKGVLLILDEIQTGIGRTGAFFAFQHEHIQPDVITLAKGLANGIPIGVTLARPAVADSFVPGDHGSTFGGNSLSCQAARAVLDYISDNRLCDNARTTGAYLMRGLLSLKDRFSTLREVRGKGLMTGVKVAGNGRTIVEACRKKGLLVNCCGADVVRFLPPLIVTRTDIDAALRIFETVLAGIEN